MIVYDSPVQNTAATRYSFMYVMSSPPRSLSLQMGVPTEHHLDFVLFSRVKIFSTATILLRRKVWGEIVL